MKKELRRINAFRKELSYDEYVYKCVTANMGTQSIYQKHHLADMCEERNIRITRQESKEQLYKLLLDSGLKPIDFERLASHYGDPTLCIGVTSQDYQKTFNITHNDVKRLERCGVLKVSGMYRVRVYGRYLNVPKYSAWQYVTISDSEIVKCDDEMGL